MYLTTEAFLKRFYLFIERGKGREKEGEKHRLVASYMHPDWESNQRPFTSQDDARPTEPHQSGITEAFNTNPL